MNPWKDLEGKSASTLRQLQNQKLHHFINTHVYPFSPYYRKLFDDVGIDPKSIRTIEDLSKIPFVNKKSLAATDDNPQRFKDFVLQPDLQKIKDHWPAPKLLSLKAQSICRGKEYVQDQLAKDYRPVFMTFTTGTTSVPTPFVYSGYDIQNLRISGARMLDLFQINPDEKIFNMFPYAPHLAFWQVFFGGLEANAFCLSTGGGKTVGTSGNIAAIGKIQPSVILGVPGYVYHVLRCAADQGCDMSFVKKIVLGASKVTVPFKKRVAALLESMGAKDVSVFGTYGFTEARSAWAESPTVLDESSGYHLYPDKEIFEVINPETGEPVGEGEDGELVYTPLDARASIVLRYRTGDFVKGGITYTKCPFSGRTVPRISSNITRLSDNKELQLTKVKGALVDLNNFAEILNEFDEIEEWQIQIGKKDNDPFECDEMYLYLCAKKGVNTGDLEETIRKKMVYATEISPNRVEFISFEEIVKLLEIETANKEKRILDVRPKE